jgi:lipopolysaccharide export system protein LptA
MKADKKRSALRSGFAACAVGLLIMADGIAALAEPTAASGVLGGFSRDSGPINIQSDSLTINDQKKIAIYKGNVVAVQGDNTLRTIELEVQYVSKEDEAKGPAAKGGEKVTKAPKAAATAVGEESQQIRRIKAKEKVVMVSTPAGKDEQSATSDFADYDVVSQTVELIGNVYIKQGKNIISGTKATLNLKTSEYSVDSAAPVVVGAPTPAAGASPAEKKRVSTTLFPNDKSGGKAAPATAPATKSLSAVEQLASKATPALAPSAKSPSKDPVTSSWTTTTPR